MLADLCFMLYSSSFFIFFRRLISELAEQNSNKIGHMLGTNCDWKIHYKNLGYPSPTNWWPKNTFLGRLRNLTANLTAYIFRMKHDIDNRSSALTTTRGLLHRPKMSWTLLHKRLQTGPPFYPPYVNQWCSQKWCVWGTDPSARGVPFPAD